MVFRSMVNDGTRFYDPLSLVSEGTKANFQVEMNSYLYGTRFMSWIAWEHSPEKLIEQTSCGLIDPGAYHRNRDPVGFLVVERQTNALPG